MKLASLYEPLTELRGYSTWNIDEQHEIMYFYYRIKTKKGLVRLFLYLFLHEKFSGVEVITENDPEMDEDLINIIQPYKDTAGRVLEKRDRMRQLFQ